MDSMSNKSDCFNVGYFIENLSTNTYKKKCRHHENKLNIFHTNVMRKYDWNKIFLIRFKYLYMIQHQMTTNVIMKCVDMNQ